MTSFCNPTTATELIISLTEIEPVWPLPANRRVYFFTDSELQKKQKIKINSGYNHKAEIITSISYRIKLY